MNETIGFGSFIFEIIILAGIAISVHGIMFLNNIQQPQALKLKVDKQPKIARR